MVKVTLVDKDRNLKPEMSAKVTFLAPDEASAPAATSGAASLPPQVLVPQTAVVSREGGPKVFEIIDNVIRVRSIVTASTRGSDVVVTRGLSGGETLVASPTQDLAEGTRVRIRGT
jgi:multidrug efflux pump subunit AcrA (membrane-fusion protein)